MVRHARNLVSILTIVAPKARQRAVESERSNGPVKSIAASFASVRALAYSSSADTCEISDTRTDTKGEHTNWREEELRRVGSLWFQRLLVSILEQASYQRYYF